MRTAWVRKNAVADPGPLRGVALARLRAISTPVLREWIENSLSKIGRIVDDGDRALLHEAQTEADALRQALQELVSRGE